MALQVIYDWLLDEECFSEFLETKYFQEESPPFPGSPDSVNHKWQVVLDWCPNEPEFYSIYVYLIDEPFQIPILSKVNFKVYDNENELIEEYYMKTFYKFMKCKGLGYTTEHQIGKKHSIKSIRKISCSLQLKRDENGSSCSEKLPYQSSRLDRDMLNLYKDKTYSDVIIKCQGKEIKVHKIILVNRSSVFKAMFKSEMTESITNTVNINDINPEALEEVLKFIYTGTVSIQYENIDDIMNFAEMYDMPDLRNYCSIELLENIVNETAVDILILSVKYNLLTVKKVLLEFIKTNISDIILTRSWEISMTKRADLMDTIIRFIHDKNK